MTSDSKTKQNLISNIYRSMSLGEEPVDLQFAEKWLQENIPGEEINQGILLSRVSPPDEVFSQNLLEYLYRFTDLLEKTKNISIGLAVKFKYTWNDANDIIDLFINTLKSCAIEKQVNPTFSIDGDYYINDFAEDYKIIARSLYCGLHVRLKSYHSDPLLPLYSFLVKLSDKARCNGKLRLSIDQQRTKIADFYRNKLNPLIITEDADVDAAVEAIAKSLCQFNREVSWSISHVFIQESIFDLSVKILENKLKKVVHGTRFDKLTELQCDQQDFVNNTHKNLKVFKPQNKSPISLCIGWSPKDVDRSNDFKKSNGYIVVIPYRNISELYSLLKENIGIYCSNVSVWSERISVKKIVSQLQFDTCWINCYGLNHPLVPINFPVIDDINFYLTHYEEIFSKPEIDSKRFPSAMLSAIQGFKEWQKANKIDDQLKVFTAVQNMFSTLNCSNQERLNKPEVSMDKLKFLVDNKINSSLLNCEISMKQSPVGIILVTLENASESPDKLRDLQCLIACSICNGNSVIINSKSIVKESLVLLTTFEKLLPKGMINFVSDFNDNFNESNKLIFKELQTGPLPKARLIKLFEKNPELLIEGFSGEVALNNPLLTDCYYLSLLTSYITTTYTV